jgi:hypothetical protein
LSNLQNSIFLFKGVKNDSIYFVVEKSFAILSDGYTEKILRVLSEPNKLSVVLEVSTMTRIRDVVQTALLTGYLTVEAENQLRQLLTTRYDLEDLNAFMTLQEAAMMGKVKQESRERCGIK